MKAICTTFLLLFLLLSSIAQTIRYVKPGGTGNGSSWATASSDLQNIINNSAVNDQVWVAKGTYQPSTNTAFVMKEGVKMYGHFAGMETLLSQRNLNSTDTSNLKGNGNRVFYNANNALTAAAVLDGFTIRDGSTKSGSGMYNLNVSPTISNCVFSNNTTTDSAYGGAMYNDNVSSVITNCIFLNNAGQRGGGIYAVGGTCTLNNCRFMGNRGEWQGPGFSFGYGGGLVAQNCTSVSVVNCTFSNNYGAGSSGAISLTNSPAVIRNSFIRYNQQGLSSAAVTSQGQPLEVYNTIFDNNTGGGLNLASGNSKVVNCLFLNNGAAGLLINAVSTKVVNCTFYGENRPIRVDGGDPSISNCIFWASSNNISFDILINGGTPAISYCDIQKGDYNGTGIIRSDPLFVNPSNPIGPDNVWGTADDGLRLPCSSPCVNGGDNNTIAATGVTTDYGGAPRNLDRVDMGIYELPATPGGKRYVKVGGSGTKDGLSWANASDNLQATINGAICRDTIFVAKGTYTPPSGQSFILREGIRVFGHFVGTESSLAQRNLNSTDTSFLRGNGASVIINDNTGLTAVTVLDGFAITDGQAASGAGIRNTNTSPAISNCVFLNNTATTNGGGIYNEGTSSPMVTNCIFKGNIGNAGGGIYNTGTGTTTVNNCIFQNNSAPAGGGGLYSTGAGSAVVTNCVFQNNTGPMGAGLYNTGTTKLTVQNTTFQNHTGSQNGSGMYNDGTATATITTCTFQNNSAIAYGGGMYNTGLAAPVLSKCVFLNNTSGTGGGGLYSGGSSIPRLLNCIFRNNTAPAGGGMETANSLNVSLTNCVFDGNTATSGSTTAGAGLRSTDCQQMLVANTIFQNNTTTGSGGGMAVISTAATIDNCTFTGNTAGAAAAIAFANGNTLRKSNIGNTIVWGNASALAYTDALAGISYSNIQGSVPAGTGNISTDPGFINAANAIGADGIWGTADDGLRLGCRSLCINAGSNNLVPDSVTTDFAGYQRIRNKVDMGVYEAASASQGKLFVTATGAGSMDGDSWASATNNLQTAINQAYCYRDSVFVTKGTYTPAAGQSFTMIEGVKIYGHFAGTETVLSQRNLRTTDTSLLMGNGNRVMNNNSNGLTTATVLDGFTLRNGSTINGGGISNIGVSPSISNCIFENNTASSAGGGMYNAGGGMPVISNCIFHSNRAVSGGGMANSSTALPAIIGCVFDGNTGTSGGAGLFNGSGTAIPVTNCVFTNNTSGGNGGAIYNSITPAIITSCTIRNNTANNGGGVTNFQSAALIRNSIIWGNSSGIYNDNSTPAISYSDVQGGVPSGTGNISADPLFVNTANPIGKDSTWGTVDDGLRVSCGSPVINAGDNNSVPAGITTDFANYTRIQNATVDMGAYEYTFAIGKKLYVNAGGAGSRYGTSWADASDNLQAMIDVAACNGDSVLVAGGTYQPASGQAFVMREGVKLLGHFAGTETGLAQRTLNSANSSILQGNGSRVIDNNGNGLTATGSLLDGFTITGGTASGDGGAGMRNSGVSPTIRNCYFKDNSSTQAGGIYFFSSSSTITNCLFTGNSAINNGAAILSVLSGIRISNSTFYKNTGTNCIQSASGGPVIQNTIVWSNTGGIVHSGLGSPSITYSDVQSSAPAGTGNVSVYPAFKDTTNFAGLDGVVGTYDDGLRLTCGSPCINAGSNAAIPAGISNDFIGTARPQNGTADIGAYEYPLFAGKQIFVATPPTGRGDGADWANATGSVLSAYDLAGCAMDTVFVKAGEYFLNGTPLVMKDKIHLYGHFAGWETTPEQRNLNSPDASILTQNNNTTVVENYNNGVTPAAVLDGFTLQKGKSTSGGGMENYNTSPTVRNCIFQNNYTFLYGGGVSQAGQAAEGPARFTDCIFRNNTSENIGAGMYISGASPLLDRCVFERNVFAIYSANPSGSAIAILGTISSPRISNSVFCYSDSVAGGSVIFASGTATPTFVNCTFAYNPGIVIYRGGSGTTLSNCILWGNALNYNLATPVLNNTASDADPLFVNGANPVGPDGIWGTADDGLRLLCNSPAVNAGSNAWLSTADTLALGNTTRIVAGTVDQGAYENATSAATTIATANTAATNVQTGTVSYGLCGSLITTLASTGASPVGGSVTAKVWIENSQSPLYVKRHYEITPASNAATATGRITLYFTQAEFDAYNAVNNTRLPAGPADASGKSNLLVDKYTGTSSDGTGLPGSYPGAATIVNPADADIVWNSALSRWEVSFDVAGFSGFFVNTRNIILPLQWLSISGNLNSSKQAVLNWKVNETNIATYGIERSTDGSNYSSTTTLTSKGNGVNIYSFTDMAPLAGIGLYRVKQIGKDGQVSYSPVVRLQNGMAGAGSMVVYPNPFKTGFTISTTQAQTAQLLDAQGKLVMTLTLKGGSNYVNAGALSAGVYLLKTKDGVMQKLIKG